MTRPAVTVGAGAPAAPGALSSGAMRRLLRSAPLLALPIALFASLPAPAAAPSKADGDLAAARALFDRNLDSIRRRDQEGYLSCYLQAPTLVRTGFAGPLKGYDALAKEPPEWPDVFEGTSLDLVPLRPGLVYGTYRYRVRYKDREESGLSERFFVKTDAGWKIAVTSAFQAPPGTPPPPRALAGATLLDGTGAAAIPDAVVVVRGGRIDCAGTRAQCPIPEGVETLDLKGAYVTPGLVDAHMHHAQTGWADGRPDFIDVRDKHPYETLQATLRAHPERFWRSYLCSGVTAVFDVGGYPWSWDLRGRATPDPMAPHVAAAGPLLSTLDFWLNLPAERQFIYLGTEKDAKSGVAYLADHGTDAVKVWFIPLETRNFDEMAQAVKAAGQEAHAREVPLIVHATGLKEAIAALKAGADLLVHSVEDAPVNEEFLRLAKSSGTIYCPTLTVLGGYRRLQEAAAAHQVPAVDDPNGCVDPETTKNLAETATLTLKPVDPAVAERRRQRFETAVKTSAANLKTVRDAGIPIAMGTDAGNPLTLHGVSVYAEMEAMQAAGLSAMEVLVASTRNGARAMRRDDQFGTIEKGKVADLLVLGADPSKDIRALRSIRYVVRGGVVRAQAELRPSAAPPRP